MRHFLVIFKPSYSGCISSIYIPTKLEKEKKNIDLNGKEISGWTPFMNACINVHKDVVKLLLKLNIYLNGKE